MEQPHLGESAKRRIEAGPAERAGVASVDVRPVRTRRELRAFIALPWRLYKGAANWVPPLISERKRHLDRRLAQMTAEGTVFSCGVSVESAAQLDGFSAVVLAGGARVPRDYKRVLVAARQAELDGADVSEAVMAAASG